MTQAVEAQLGRRLPDGWQEQFQHLYREAFDAELAPVDGIVEALDQIEVLTGVASSGTHDKIRYSLRRTGLHQRFEGRGQWCSTTCASSHGCSAQPAPSSEGSETTS